MSRIEELIKEKCPAGVEYRKLDDVLMYEQPTKYIVSNTEYDNSNPIPVLTAGQSFILGYTDEIDGVYKASKEKPVIIFDDFTTSFHWVDFEFKVKSSAMKMLRPRDWNKYNFRYLYYAMCTIGYVPVEHSRQWISNYSQFEIPVPPIEVQQEIVCILDKFAELESGLQDELDARQKQYEYCRDSLFAFDKNVEYKNILDVISMKARVGWQALTKKEYLQEGEYYLITGTDFVEEGSIAFDSCVFVSEERYDMDENIKVHAEDILMTKDGTLGKVAFVEKEPPKPATLNGGVYRLTVISDEVLPRYMYHYFTSHEFKCFVEKVKTGGTIKHLTQKWFETLEVPIPSIEVQKTIIKSLDSFNVLCYRKNIGLVAEIEARHKQYEYYRDKLLTFERKVV